MIKAVILVKTKFVFFDYYPPYMKVLIMEVLLKSIIEVRVQYKVRPLTTINRCINYWLFDHLVQRCPKNIHCDNFRLQHS